MKSIHILSYFLLFNAVLYADNLLHPSAPKLDRPTLTTLGVQLPITGDDNFNASVTLQYRVTGTTTWKTGLPLFRVHPETVAGYTVTPQFAGSVFDLLPATSYDLQLRATDPDGGDQTFNLTAKTRPVPADPVSPRVRNVVDSSSLISALSTAAPGDVITLANGYYPGLFAVFSGGTASNPIVIRGASQDGVVLDGGNCTGCNIFEVYGGGYVHIEQLTMQNAERAIRFQQTGAIGNVLRRIHVKNTSLGVGGQPNQLDFYFADNIFEGRLLWPHVYWDDGGKYASQDGLAVFGTGHVVAHNRISGFGDAMTTGQDGARAIDFYGNEIVYTYDNGIELDGSEGNTRCFRNRFTNTFATISVQPVHGGPAYVFRNVVVNAVAEQLKFHGLGTTPPQEPSGILVYNNTFVSPPTSLDLNMQTSSASHYFEIENNLFIGTSAPEAADWSGLIDHGTFDYNGYFPDGIFRFYNPAYGGYFLAQSFAGLQSVGMERNGVLAKGPLFASGLTAPLTYTALLPPADVTLATGSIALNRGRVLPNINDAFQGSGPDLGALEQGCPQPIYGPRPVGVDERNEVLGCTPSGGGVTSVVVNPGTATLGRSQTQQFAAVTSPAGSPVTWQIAPARGSISASGLYTAPADALLGESVTVKAISNGNGAVSGSATVSLTAPVTVTLAPATVTLSGSTTQQFTATVSGAANPAVSWVLSPALGSMTAGGLYTAPAASSKIQNLTVTAASVADASKLANSSVTIKAAAASITITPSVRSVTFGTTQQFQSDTPVVWTIVPQLGSISSTGLYTAPQGGARLAVTVIATSISNPQQSGFLTFVLQK